MTLEERMDRLEEAWGETDPIVRELRDTITVMSGIEARQSRMIKEHSEWLASHDKTMREHDDRMKVLGERITSLISGFGEFMRRSG